MVVRLDPGTLPRFSPSERAVDAGYFQTELAAAHGEQQHPEVGSGRPEGAEAFEDQHFAAVDDLRGPPNVLRAVPMAWEIAVRRWMSLTSSASIASISTRSVSIPA